ncbi:hypothetical protein G4Y79_05215 [Phototrophicus methaneseepsis]|uniref:Uncharacterized protein n=1 Tax=Phototrophicus methaneseepsis TaxID=2710758 RepID=A0A7S8EB96_9CHLR|nr:hypothetical protein [Phototrophicus methaneseepsis]QPC83780.1 hypothetical protein G4Y79_05215 [Phototrophicus methaneseepsis]
MSQNATSDDITKRLAAVAGEVEGIKAGIIGEPKGALPDDLLPCLLVHPRDEKVSGFTFRVDQRITPFYLDILILRVTHTSAALVSDELALVLPYRERVISYFRSNPKLKKADTGVVYTFRLTNGGQPGHKTVTRSDKNEQYLGLRFEAEAVTYHTRSS